MTTYSTIKEAFANGQGDVFYTDGNKFICFSRHDDRDNEMAAIGFERLTYDQVCGWAELQNSPIKNIETILRESATANVTYRTNDINGRDGYYDEFPDAYGQHL